MAEHGFFGSALICPNAIGSASDAAGNETDAICGQPPVAITADACRGASTQQNDLGDAIRGMMKRSNNFLSNGIESVVGGGVAGKGWDAMLDGAGTAAGMVDIGLVNRMGGPMQPEFDLTTPRDLEGCLNGWRPILANWRRALMPRPPPLWGAILIFSLMWTTMSTAPSILY